MIKQYHPRMPQHPWAVVVAISGVAIMGIHCARAKAGQSAAPAVEQMIHAGPQEAELALQAGDWNVVATLWPAPNAPPMVTRDLVARRAMIGAYLQEVMPPAAASKVPDFRRIDYLNFDHVEGRWKYVSMDTRFPVSIMPAQSTGLANDRKIVLNFEPQGFVGFGPTVEGRLMLSDMNISSVDKDHMLKEQRINLANGTGEGWLFVRYEYERRK